MVPEHVCAVFRFNKCKILCDLCGERKCVCVKLSWTHFYNLLKIWLVLLFIKAITEKQFSFDEAKELDRDNERRPLTKNELDLIHAASNVNHTQTNINNNINTSSTSTSNNDHQNPKIQIINYNNNYDESALVANLNEIKIRVLDDESEIKPPLPPPSRRHAADTDDTYKDTVDVSNFSQVPIKRI